MSVLNLECVTTDPGATTFYGYAYVDNEPGQSIKGKYTVLVKSNANPTSPIDLRWTVVSMIDNEKLGGYRTFTVPLSCTISAQGVFTMIARTTRANSVPHIIRYDPAGKIEPTWGFKGPGAWTTIGIDPSLK